MNASHADYRNDATYSMKSRISFKSGVLKALRNTSLLLLACSGAAFGQIYPKGEWDRCGKNLHPTPTSNFCVSAQKELEEGRFGHKSSEHKIKDCDGESIGLTLQSTQTRDNSSMKNPLIDNNKSEVACNIR